MGIRKRGREGGRQGGRERGIGTSKVITEWKEFAT